MGKLRIKKKKIKSRGINQFAEEMERLSAEGKISGCGFDKPEKDDFTSCCDCPYQPECNPDYQNQMK